LWLELAAVGGKTAASCIHAAISGNADLSDGFDISELGPEATPVSWVSPDEIVAC